MDTGGLFGLIGLIVALASLVYVRTQAEASRAQAEASAEQARTAVRLSALEASMRLAERTFGVRAAMGRQSHVMESYSRANPEFMTMVEEIGGFDALLTYREFIDTTMNVYLLRKEGIVTDAHWRNWQAAVPLMARVTECQRVFDNAVARGIYDEEFSRFFRAAARGESLVDPIAGTS